MRVELRHEATEDLVHGAAFYANQSSGLAAQFLEGIQDDLKRLESTAGIHEVYRGVHRLMGESST